MDAAVEAVAERARAGELARLGIMGGTFDPIHLGHLVCAEEAREALGLDAVLFMPTGCPAFKLDREVAPGEARLRMCRAAAAGNPAFAVSALEVERARASPTRADTLRALHAALPGVKLVFIVGADAALTLPRWRESAELARLATFAAATRPGFELGEEALRDLRERGFDIRSFAVTALDVSSSELRRRVAEGRTIRYLVPEVVREIIEEEQLYRKEVDHGRLA